MDFETMYVAMDSRDSRFDGRFFVAVKTTGIYCRPICPAPTPRRQNTVFYRYAAVAELAGFRPCRRCHPEKSPDTPEWDTRPDLVGRGLRLLAEGVVDESGVSGLADRLGVSERHLQRTFKTEIGTTPGVVARSRRARLARQLLIETSMPISHVAFAAGFSSIRAFNETIDRIYRMTPTAMRSRGDLVEGPMIELELQYRTPITTDALLGWLARKAIPGVEEVTDGAYRRTTSFGRGSAIVELRPGPVAVSLKIDAAEVDHLAPIIQRARRLMDLDADPEAIDSHLSGSPLLGPHVKRRPGMRLPGAYDPFQTTIVAVLSAGSGKGAELAGQIARTFGEPIRRPSGSLTHVFPSPSHLVSADLGKAGIPASRARTVRHLAGEVDRGRIALDGSMDPRDAIGALRAIKGIGPETAASIAMHVLRDPDAFPPRLYRSTYRLIDDTGGAGASPMEEWRPWRAYAAMHLWSLAAESGLAVVRSQH